MLNIVIPMAGLGSRFQKVGYDRPKPFIDVLGKGMIEHVLDNLHIPNAQFILVMQKDHLPFYHQHLLNKFKIEIVTVEGLTMGSVCTVLAAHRLINNEQPLMIANSDQLVDIPIADFVKDSHSRKLDGSILTFINPDKDAKWSYVAVDQSQLVIQAREKVAISDRATVGIYLFAQGKSFVENAIDMIVQNERSNNEFYTCPLYNYLIRRNLKIGVFDIPRNSMHGLGTPEDLEIFLRRKSL